jgi:hypothetical protein
MKSVRRLSATAALFLFFQPSFAQKLVDPNTVAPEFRAAAEKRRVEQITLNECAKKAAAAKVTIRDRATFISACAESSNRAATGDTAPRWSKLSYGEQRRPTRGGLKIHPPFGALSLPCNPR